ncbi:MAG: response regulator containing a CheY-like receiver domain and a domain [Bacteroidetes bacterium]|jgi:CheY-like chemotaxis protein|nr:response regulator containing a CheY-like receiver domain and a domain [Bacteroidota bacterium]
MEDISKTKILIVDDDVFTIRLLTEILVSNPDYEILTASTGSSAIDVVLREMPSLIIMDWQMPEISGIEATILLKQNLQTKDIPIILISGVTSSSEDAGKAIFTGAIDFMRKPVEKAELLARVSSILQLSKAYIRIKEQNFLLQEQLTTKMLDIQQFESMRDNILKGLNSIKESDAQEDTKQMINIIESYISGRNTKINWDGFKTQVDTLFPDFFKKLSKKQLTNYELQLCAYIRLNMNSKQISNLMYTSLNTINIARKRLKKKLGLGAGESLQIFLQNI